MVTDVRMPEMDGMELVAASARRWAWRCPMIVMTGHGDVPLAVEAMKAGRGRLHREALRRRAMLSAPSARPCRSAARSAARRTPSGPSIVRRIETLSLRERQVLDGLVAGKANKVIAYDLDISPRTVEIYRAHVMTKMQARSLSELVRMALMVGVA